MRHDSVSFEEKIRQPLWKKYTFKFSADLHVNKALYWFCHLFVVNIDDDVNARIAEASAAFVRLRGSI